MFNPHQIMLLRENIAATPDIGQFHGKPLARMVLRVATDGPALCAEGTAQVGKMYPPAAVFGTPIDPKCLNGVGTFDLPLNRPLVQVVNDGMCIGNEAVVTPTGALYAPNYVCTDAMMLSFVDGNATNHHGFLVTKHNDRIEAIFAAPFCATRIEATALFLHNLESGNYGSFIIRQLPQLLFAKQSGIRFDCYVVPDRTPWLMAALRESGMPDYPIYTLREVSGRPFKRILMPGVFDNEGFISENVLSSYRDMVAAAEAVPWMGGDKIYVSRSLSSSSRPDYRVLENEPEIEDMARSAGYLIVHPETLSFQQQIATFSRARRILGPSGSGMTNIAFASPESKVVDLESFTHNVRQHAKIYASSGKTYAFGFGETVPGDDRPLFIRSWAVSKSVIKDVFEWLAA